MTRPARETAFLFGVLALMGAGWGLTQPLAKIAVMGGYRPLGLIFWQAVIGFAILAALQIARKRPFRTDPAALRIYLMIALIGTVLPNSASYEAARHLPAGLISILLALVPMFAFPIALALGNERFQPTRLLGLCLGLAGVLLIMGPEASLPDRAMVAVVPIAMIAPMFYASESNLVARWGTAGLEATEVLLGASAIAALIALPLALATGQFIDPRPPWGAADLAYLLSSLIHVAVYCAYVWMVTRAGAIFTVQVSYLVTGFGVIWAMALLGERYSLWVWGAMVLMLCGMFLVQPRQSGKALDAAEKSRQHGA